MNESVADIVEANRQRYDALTAPYSPERGWGSPIPRVEVVLEPSRSEYVPALMAETLAARQIIDAGSVRAWAERQGMAFEDALDDFHTLRCRYDFEFWCSQAAMIEVDAETRAEVGKDVARLKLNRAQRIYFKTLHDQFFGGVPVRVILLKARQWGGSTLTQCFFVWIQKWWHHSWNAFICALQKDQARHLRGMYERLAEHYPKELGGSITLVPHQGSTNVRRVVEHDSIVGVSSIENPNSPRSYSIHLAHLSEVGLWPSTPKVNAESYAQAITGAVANEPGTVIVEESTAKGVGTYFHQHWQDAGTERSSYEPVFIAWHDIPKYTEEVADPAAFARQTLRPDRTDATDEKIKTARRLWREGATLQGIRWYLRKLADMKGDLRRMQNEFPTTAAEAFQSSGDRFFSFDLTAKVRAGAKPPRLRGKLTAEGEEGEEALTGITFREREGGRLKVWRRPDDKVFWRGQILNPEGRIIKGGRFAAFADFGGKTQNADWSVITVVDRIKMIEGGPAEVVARLRVHQRPDLFAWRCARIAQWYDEALLGLEINRHRKDRGDEKRGHEPEWSLAVIEQIKHAYANLYLRTVEERIDEPVRFEVGFHMNSSTKPLILNTLEAGLEDGTLIEPDRRAADELDVFESKPDGRLGAVEGNHDDVVISVAGAAWLALKYMDRPKPVDPKPERRKPKPSAARF